MQSDDSAVLLPTVGVITVTHNSGPFFSRYMQALAAQTCRPSLVVVVDAGSTDDAFLQSALEYGLPVEILREKNVGFAAGNNLGWAWVKELDYTLFLNPDAFPSPRFLEDALRYLESNKTVGMVMPTLLGYELASDLPTGTVDSTGIVRNARGLLVDRDQGRPVSVLSRYASPNELPWMCAATMLARRKALEEVAVSGKNIFDPDFFMYKEDIDLSWRVRLQGWRLVHHPGLTSFHCRGWQDRRRMPRRMRVMSARNEVRMYWKARSPFIFIALAKFAVATVLNL